MKEYKERIHSKTYKANTDLSLYSAGIEQCKSEYTYGPIVRSYYVMHFVFSGKGQLTINEHSFDVKAGDIFLIPANKVATYQADKNHPWKYGWVNFLGINAEQYFYSLTKDTHDQYIIHNVDVNQYYKQIERLLDLSFNTDAEYFESNSILLHIFAMLYEELNIHFNNNVKYSLAEEIRLYLDLNYQYNLKMSEIADKFGIHANYMTRLFHQKFDISPKQYLLSIKLKRLQACYRVQISLYLQLQPVWALLMLWPFLKSLVRLINVHPHNIVNKQMKRRIELYFNSSFILFHLNKFVFSCT